jgi:hypothetical protein
MIERDTKAEEQSRAISIELQSELRAWEEKSINMMKERINVADTVSHLETLGDVMKIATNSYYERENKSKEVFAHWQERSLELTRELSETRRALKEQKESNKQNEKKLAQLKHTSAHLLFALSNKQARERILRRQQEVEDKSHQSSELLHYLLLKSFKNEKENDDKEKIELNQDQLTDDLKTTIKMAAVDTESAKVKEKQVKKQESLPNSEKGDLNVDTKQKQTTIISTVTSKEIEISNTGTEMISKNQTKTPTSASTSTSISASALASASIPASVSALAQSSTMKGTPPTSPVKRAKSKIKSATPQQMPKHQQLQQARAQRRDRRKRPMSTGITGFRRLQSSKSTTQQLQQQHQQHEQQQQQQ